MERKIRIVMGKPGLDGHDRGIFPWAYLCAIDKGDAEKYLTE